MKEVLKPWRIKKEICESIKLRGVTRIRMRTPMQPRRSRLRRWPSTAYAAFTKVIHKKILRIRMVLTHYYV